MDITYVALSGSATDLPVELIDVAFERLVKVDRVITVDAALDVDDETFSFLLGVDASTVGAEHTTKAAQFELNSLGLLTTVTG